MKASVKKIRLRGARQNNLKGIDLDLPPGKLIVITGLSGAGKSSLLFEVLHAEGQRRYVETFSPYVRQFLETLPRPKVDEIENVRPSIAVEQRNAVRTTRSTVGTMTDLCDYFKVWFPCVAELIDPATDKVLQAETPATLTKSILAEFADQTLVIGFRARRPDAVTPESFLRSLSKAGYARASDGKQFRRFEEWVDLGWAGEEIFVGLDRLSAKPARRKRLRETVASALRVGRGELLLVNEKGQVLGSRYEGLRSPATGECFAPPSPSLFSFNSPVGACPLCRGFGRTIEVDYRRVIPDESLSIGQGAVRAFSGQVYGHSQRDLLRAARRHDVPTDKPWRFLSEEEKNFVLDGEPDYVEDADKWYGLRRFFRWLESKTYKMHVRVFLSKYRGYFTCSDCQGTRLRSESLLRRWRGHTLPDLYALPVDELSALLRKHAASVEDPRAETALEGICARLGYLEQVGLGYLSLDRPSRTLSGGETQRVNLTSCLGASLTETLFALDEPSIGLHPSDVERLIGILHNLTAQGNTVCVVEHDERIIRAADLVVEIGPEPGEKGGFVVFTGSISKLLKDKKALTGAYLSGARSIEPPLERSPKKALDAPLLRIRGASLNNLRNFNLDLPLARFVALAGVSGSGKSSLLEHVIRQGLLAARGLSAEEPARIKSLRSDVDFADIVSVDQTPLSRTPRSNPALYADAWDSIRGAFARSEDARQAGFTPSHFSFNAGEGRCEQCEGLGYERTEMQFLSDVFSPCPACEGRRFKDEVLAIRMDDLDVSQALELSVSEAAECFARIPKAARNLRTLEQVGLGYLALGQPLNTLSGGESQRLKLVKYLTGLDPEGKPSLLLLDEPTTGLHLHDVATLLQTLRGLTENGHSLVVIEHHPDVLAAADHLVELGPGAGKHGGKVVAQGPPRKLARGNTPTAPVLAATFGESLPDETRLVAETKKKYGCKRQVDTVKLTGVRENNLKNLSISIPRNALTVVTGPSGSGKSSLAFDVVFAEGQRRFLESMSSYARRFVEQLPRPEIDELVGIAPTVAIEQRVTAGIRKSTVGTITEVTHYLRLLFARLGVQISPATGEPVETATPEALAKRAKSLLDVKLNKFNKKEKPLLCAPLAKGRKGHHRPLAEWAASKGYEQLRCDGELMPAEGFEGLARYVEHDIDVVLSELSSPFGKSFRPLLDEALALGKGTAYLHFPNSEEVVWLSLARVDPVTGESFPLPDPKHFSRHSPRGWCPDCRGYGRMDERLRKELPADGIWWTLRDGDLCPTCAGSGIGRLGRLIVLRLKGGGYITLPDMLRLTPSAMLETLSRLSFDAKGLAVAELVLPEIRERLAFMENVGLGYLSLNREANTLSGGEAQRIRLAAQLGSNLSGALYVLDEPSIGLHPQDNERLLDSLERLKEKGNTLLVVEHDEETMRRADYLLDLGPEAGVAGGEILARGAPGEVLKSHKSLTAKYLREGMNHPMLGARRKLPARTPTRRVRKIVPEWLGLLGAEFRNLRDVDLWLPVNKLVAVCGVSGAGKSTLVRGLLKPAVAYATKNKLEKLVGADLAQKEAWKGSTSSNRGPFLRLLNGNAFTKVIEVDQSPIGKTPRSTPATYIGAWDRVRTLMTTLPEAKARGLAAGYFSFNMKGGRCETCKGAGRVKLEMHFLPDAYLPCDDCKGMRYGEDALDLQWRGKSVGEMLDMSFREAAEFFAFDRKLGAVMNLMVETGLGYLKLGQSSPTLSGGEAQRVKLVAELAKGLYLELSRGGSKGNLYLLEEPTIGLHPSDCEKLLRLLHRLVDEGHTVVVIEHHADVLAEADYLVEIGPGGGQDGGRLLYAGSPEKLVETGGTPTSPFLEDVLNWNP